MRIQILRSGKLGIDGFLTADADREDGIRSSLLRRSSIVAQ